MTLYDLTGQYKQLLEMIESGDFTPEELQDTLEGIEGAIEVKADNYAKIMKQIAGNVSTIDTEIKRLSAVKLAFENSATTMKKNLYNSMKITGREKFKTDLFSFGIQKNGGVRALTLAEDINTIPDEYMMQPPKVPNKDAIRELLATTEVTWAKLEPQGESLRIR